MLALVAKKKLRARARSLGCPAALAPLSNSCRMVVRIVSTCGFPASIRFAISRVLSCVPVGRKSTDASFSFATGRAESDDAARAVELAPERLAAASRRSRLRRAIRSMMVFVIVVPAGLLKAPPRPSAACCATAEAHVVSTSRTKNPYRLTRNLFLSIFDASINYTDSNSQSLTAETPYRKAATKVGNESCKSGCVYS